MRKGTDLIGKPIIAFDTGEAFEKVQDLIFDQANNALLGLLVDEGGWFHGDKVLPWPAVQSVGPDAVIVPEKNAVVHAERLPNIHRILQRNNVLRNTKIYTTDGRDLGTLVDLFFDEKTGEVEGYEVSGGIFADMATGRSFVPAPQTIKIGEDAAFVPPEVADQMDEQVGGVQGALQTAGDQIHQATAAAGDKLEDLSGEARAKAYEAVAGQSVDQARGRRVRQTVRSADGTIIAATGQIVTDRVIERARAYHQEQQLLAATGLSTGEAAQQGANTALASAGAGIDGATQQLSSGATDLWQRVKSKVDDLRDQTDQKVEEQRIKAALGRPVTRVILDPQDQVILNVGELITHEAIDQSRRAGVLDILLDSVYTREPELAPEELRAPEPGEASLEKVTR